MSYLAGIQPYRGICFCIGCQTSVDYTIVPDEIRRDADLYIVALKDAVLRQLAPVLVKGREQALFVHYGG